MKISHALLRLTILAHALASTTTLAKVPPLFDGYVETKSIENRELNFLQVNSTDLALEERGVKSGDSDIESRQVGFGIIVVAIVSTIVIGIVLALVFSIEDDNPVSSNLMPLIFLALTMIRHSVVRHTLRTWSPSCMVITPMPTMLYATQIMISRSMGPRAQIGIICTTSFQYPWEGQ
jgi:hypothetical protein